MKYPIVRAATFALLAAAATPSLAAEATGGVKLTASLSGANEVPAADADGAGTFAATVNPGQMQVCYDLTVSNIAAATMAHIHTGAAGVNGPVLVSLTAPASGSSKACATVTRDVALNLIKAPGDYYVNVHNAEFPGGAVRGQLSK